MRWWRVQIRPDRGRHHRRDHPHPTIKPNCRHRGSGAPIGGPTRPRRPNRRTLNESSTVSDVVGHHSNGAGGIDPSVPISQGAQPRCNSRTGDLRRRSQNMQPTLTQNVPAPSRGARGSGNRCGDLCIDDHLPGRMLVDDVLEPEISLSKRARGQRTLCPCWEYGSCRSSDTRGRETPAHGMWITHIPT
jgi:hypothetical protein